MPRRLPARARFATLARWPIGLGVTSWRYFWRTLPVHRRELSGTLPQDAPPDLPRGVDLDDVQRPSDGVGPLVHRIYRTEMVGAGDTPEQLLERITADLNASPPRSSPAFTS